MRSFKNTYYTFQKESDIAWGLSAILAGHREVNCINQISNLKNFITGGHIKILKGQT